MKFFFEALFSKIVVKFKHVQIMVFYIQIKFNYEHQINANFSDAMVAKSLPLLTAYSCAGYFKKYEAYFCEISEVTFLNDYRE